MKQLAKAILATSWWVAGVAGAADRCLPAMTTRDTQAIEQQLKDAAKLCRALDLEQKPEGNQSLIRVLAAIFPAKVPGGDRLKPAAPLGMPTGPTMPREGQIAFDASEVAGEGLVSLAIAGPQVSVPAAGLPASGIFVLPASRLRPGTDYRWILTTRRQRYEGSFALPDEETMTRVQARLRTLADSAPEPRARLLFEAAIYDDEELFASRDLVVLAYRREFRN